MTFEEAEVTLVCRKLFCQRLDPENMNLHDEVEKIKGEGYSEANAEAKLCHPNSS
jgi:hypothetical protein